MNAAGASGRSPSRVWPVEDDPAGHHEVPRAPGLSVSAHVSEAGSAALGGGFMRFSGAGGALRGWTLTYDEVVYVIEGELVIVADGEEVRVPAGSACLIEAGATVDYLATGAMRGFVVVHPRWPATE
ncbi:cupin domain-containing protein [Spirillospora sp. NBC_00431]